MKTRLVLQKKVQKLARELSFQTEIYPDGHASDLRKTVADFYDISEEELIFTAGVDELIELLTRVLLDATTNTVMATQHLCNTDKMHSLKGQK